MTIKLTTDILRGPQQGSVLNARYVDVSSMVNDALQYKDNYEAPANAVELQNRAAELEAEASGTTDVNRLRAIEREVNSLESSARSIMNASMPDYIQTFATKVSDFLSALSVSESASTALREVVFDRDSMYAFITVNGKEVFYSPAIVTLCQSVALMNLRRINRQPLQGAEKLTFRSDLLDVCRGLYNDIALAHDGNLPRAADVLNGNAYNGPSFLSAATSRDDALLQLCMLVLSSPSLVNECTGTTAANSSLAALGASAATNIQRLLGDESFNRVRNMVRELDSSDLAIIDNLCQLYGIEELSSVTDYSLILRLLAGEVRSADGLSSFAQADVMNYIKDAASKANNTGSLSAASINNSMSTRLAALAADFKQLSCKVKLGADAPYAYLATTLTLGAFVDV